MFFIVLEVILNHQKLYVKCSYTYWVVDMVGGVLCEYYEYQINIIHHPLIEITILDDVKIAIYSCTYFCPVRGGQVWYSPGIKGGELTGRSLEPGSPWPPHPPPSSSPHSPSHTGLM